jgi:hypothetical protein
MVDVELLLEGVVFVIIFWAIQMMYMSKRKQHVSQSSYVPSSLWGGYVLPPRGATCSISWTPTSPCEGDCHYATQTVVGTIVVQAPDCPTLLTSVSECEKTMPCLCYATELPPSTQGLQPQVTTCSSCDAVPTGSTCQFSCADPSDQFQGAASIVCLNTGWAQVDPNNQPTCLPKEIRCPNIVTDETVGRGVLPLSTCFNAVQGDTCGTYCKPGRARAPGSPTFATCQPSGSTGIGVWVDSLQQPVDLDCHCQVGCAGAGPDTCGANC